MLFDTKIRFTDVTISWERPITLALSDWGWHWHKNKPGVALLETLSRNIPRIFKNTRKLKCLRIFSQKIIRNSNKKLWTKMISKKNAE